MASRGNLLNKMIVFFMAGDFLRPSAVSGSSVWPVEIILIASILLCLSERPASCEKHKRLSCMLVF